MKKLLPVLIILIFSFAPAFAFGNFGKMSEQDSYMTEVYGVSKKQIKKLNRMEKRTNRRLQNALYKIRMMRYNIDIPHDVVSSYSQRTLSKIKSNYEKNLDKILTLEQKQGYREYISKAY